MGLYHQCWPVSHWWDRWSRSHHVLLRAQGQSVRDPEECALHIFYGGNVLASWGCCVALIDCSCQDQRVTQRQENSWGLRIPGTARSCWRLKGEGETKLLYSVTQKARCGASSWMLSIFQIPTMFLPKVWRGETSLPSVFNLVVRDSLKQFVLSNIENVCKYRTHT